jgi:hypothetical protein
LPLKVFDCGPNARDPIHLTTLAGDLKFARSFDKPLIEHALEGNVQISDAEPQGTFATPLHVR